MIKNHYEPTLDVSLLLRREIRGLEIFGGIDLNHVVGGVNAAIVEHMGEALSGSSVFRPRAALAPRTGIVWMPTLDSENAVRAANRARPFLTVSRGGELVSEMKSVISVIAKYGLVLATGHNSAAEALMILREGRAQGVQHMVVTHAMGQPDMHEGPSDEGSGRARSSHRVRLSLGIEPRSSGGRDSASWFPVRYSVRIPDADAWFRAAAVRGAGRDG